MLGHSPKCRLDIFLILFFLPIHGEGQLKKTHLNRADREAWNAILKTPKGCEESFSATHQESDYSGLEFFRINSIEYLVYVECYSGAYQPGGILYLLKERPAMSAEILKLEGFNSEDDDGNPLPYSMIDGFPSFARRSMSLEIFSKSRGMGDCGQFARYGYKQGKFSLIEFREQECNQNSLGSTDYHHWPVRKHS